METARIAELLGPFTAGQALTPELLQQFGIYLELLLRWNRPINLTAVRDAESIVTRHFGESLLAARALFPSSPAPLAPTPAADNLAADAPAGAPRAAATLADVGSGAGFPGLVIKLAVPDLRLTLIESQNKKATFLREAVRALALSEAEIFAGRAEDWGRQAEVVTLRAVEKFAQVLPVAASLVAVGGRLALLIGASQVESTKATLASGWTWRESLPVPGSRERVLLIGERGEIP